MGRRNTKLIDIVEKIQRIHIEEIFPDEDFMDSAARFANIPGTVVLMSGGEMDCSRYHIIAAKPWLTFSGRGREIEIVSKGKSFSFKTNPFDILQELLHLLKFSTKDCRLPVTAGFFGYLAYDLKDHLEKLPRTSIDSMGLPGICLFAPSIILIFDKQEKKTWLCVPSMGEKTLKNDLEAFREIMKGPPPEAGRFKGEKIGFHSNFTKQEYMDSIRKIKEYIASGHVYQVNMAQRFEMDFTGDGFALFKTLFNNNPAPFFAYVNAGDHKIVSTSPERFILRQGEKVETRPIKGTRPRSKTPSQDKAFAVDLRNSKKDDAELSMIVDLLRNDIGKVCKEGSVIVSEHKRLEAYENVYHLVSIVKGELESGMDSVDLIKASFPGGSITGCPKIRSMEIIDELEPVRRHIYTGSLGYISFHDTMDLSIVIRTATIVNGKIVFSVGGGIVHDSDPEDEFDETLHKGRTLIDVFGGKGESTASKKTVWINGMLKDGFHAGVPLTDPGFQYGFGFFETIRVVNGTPIALENHMERFSKTWNCLFNRKEPDLTWDDVISRVISANRLDNQVSALKIIATRGNRQEAPFDNTIAVMARPYTHRLEGANEKGLRLAVYPEPRQTPLAEHKTLNYLYYFIAGAWAKENNGDEALILNPDGTLSETNSANILVIEGKRAIRPKSPAVLPGIMENLVLKILKSKGFTIESRNLFPEDLLSVDQVLLTNSLMGAVPVISIDGKAVGRSENLCESINRIVLNPA